MLLKTIIDNSVKNVSKDSNSQSEYSPKDFERKTVSLPKKQNQKLLQDN